MVGQMYDKPIRNFAVQRPVREEKSRETWLFAVVILLVLVLAWYHGDKGEQRVSRPELAILTVLVAVVGGTVWWYVSRLEDSAWRTGSSRL